MGSTLMTYPNDEFLHEDFVAMTIQKYLTGELIAEQESTIRDIGDADSVSWIEEAYSDRSDPLRPASLDTLEIIDGSLFPHVNFSKFVVESAVLKTYGIEMDFSQACRRNTQMVDFIQRGLARGAYWLATLLNDLVFNTMTNSWSTTASTETNSEPWNVAAGVVWSDTTSTPSRECVKDIKAIKLMVEDTENYNNDVDRAYLRKDNYSELGDYLQFSGAVGYPWANDPQGKPRKLTVDGVVFDAVHKLAGIPTSTGLFLSRGKKPTTIYERVDPHFARQKLKDNSGNTLPGAYHVHKYFSDDDHVTHIQVWREMYPVSTRWDRKTVGILRTL